MAGLNGPAGEAPARATARVGVVVIGRNEAATLAACLDSVAAPGRTVIYVDSGSRDDSVAIAHARGAAVIELDPARPFTAARARNEGFARLRALERGVEHVQFVDGDCEVVPGWIEAGVAELDAVPALGAVCGRLLERHPEASPWNRLCALDWAAQPAGDGAYCGILLVRAATFAAIGGFAIEMIAGEDPDLSLRLARAGSPTRRLARDMAWHDARLLTFGAWFRRTLRTGHSDAELALRHRDRARFHAVASQLFWGFALPLAVAAAALILSPWSLLALLLYPTLWLRIRSRTGAAFGDDGSLYATGCIAAKFAQALGALRYLLARAGILPRRGLIE